MTRNKNKIIRSVTVSQSLGFCREVMIKMRAMGYEMVAVWLTRAIGLSALVLRM